MCGGGEGCPIGELDLLDLGINALFGCAVQEGMDC